MKRIRLIVCDLDGTLLNDQKLISDFSVQTLQEAAARGAKLCLASGRNEQMMSIYIKQLGGCDYILSDNGAMVSDRTGAALVRESLAPDMADRILAYLNREAMAFMMYSDQRMYFSEGDLNLQQRITDYEKLSRQAGYPVVIDADQYVKSKNAAAYGEIVKIVAYEDDREKMQRYAAFLEALPAVSYEPTGYGLMGVFKKGVSKEESLRVVMKDAALMAAQVCVFGDYHNDLSMFRCAGHKVCMGNGVAALKQAADYITLGNNEDGVAVYLNKVMDQIGTDG